jgi:hypothetical protein
VIAELAERQHGVMSRAQLLAAGVSDDMIGRRLAWKRVERLHAGVFGLPTIGERGRFMAAVLAAGDGAVLSHRSAGALWDLRSQSWTRVDVTAPRRGVRGGPGLRLHTTRSLHPADVTELDGIPCTTVPRTLIDLAGHLTPHDLNRLLERTLILRVFDKRAFDDALARANGRRGAGTLRRLIDELADQPPPTRSELERRFLELIQSASLPSPVVNGVVCGHEVDFHWPDARLIVETDGAETHDTPSAFHTDRGRDLDLELADWHVIRITWRQLRDQPERIVALLRRRLGPLRG